MLATGNQLRAARALLGVEQGALADMAGVNVNTIRNMEGGGSGPIAGRAASVQAVQRALEAAGVEFLNHGRPGVRLRSLRPDEGLRPDQLTTENDG
jgi:transcriptional regulator with XRE-family HTH domain